VRGSPNFLAARLDLVRHPHPPLHHPLLSWIPHILETLNFVGVLGVPLVGLDLLPRVQKMMQYVSEYSNISELTCWVWTLDSQQVPPSTLTPSS
jgi:hypothetical protein